MTAPVKGFKGHYGATIDGHIVTFKADVPRVLAARASGAGYLAVQLSKDGISTQRYIHRLVFEAWGRKLKNKEEINHIDGDKRNNRFDNLEAVTPKQNSQHAWDTGLSNRTQGNRCKLTEAQVLRIKELRAQGLLLREIAVLFEVCEGTVSMIVNEVTWK